MTDWMKNIAKNPPVSVKIGSEAFEVTGRITSNGEAARELGKKALYEKYYGSASKETIDDWFDLSTVVELTPIS